MIGLRPYERDLDLARQVDAGRLAVPTAEELSRLIGAHLAPAIGPVRRIELEYARWKPGVALVTSWGVELDGGVQALVTHKVYAGEKARHVADHFEPDVHAIAACAPLAPNAVLPDAGAFLTTFPVDRVLRGAGRVMNLRRTARQLDQAGIWEPWVMRLRASRLEPLRYKPERRVVFRLDARLRGEDGERDQRSLGVRVLAPAVAARVALVREGLEAEFLPRLRFAEVEAGVLVEDWLPGQTGDPDDYRDGQALGRLLHRLHSLPVDRPLPAAKRLGGLETLHIDPALAGAVPLPLPAPAATGWVHGDLHPDQVLEHRGDRWLLDLDTLRAGAPEEDLASWVAGRLDLHPEMGLGAAAGELLEGYRSAGGQVDTALLRQLVVFGLASRAAAGIRRLERDALATAARRLELARAVHDDGGAR